MRYKMVYDIIKGIIKWANMIYHLLSIDCGQLVVNVFPPYRISHKLEKHLHIFAHIHTTSCHHSPT